MPETVPLARIQPARWFRHALSAGELTQILESRLRAFECSRDARAAFCAARLAGLRHVHGLLESGAFGASGAWIERVELEHVHQYLRAADSWDRGELSIVAAPWRAIFAREHQGETTITASLRAGAIAHLAYDLPLALARIGVQTAESIDVATAYAQLTHIYASTADEAAREATSRHASARLARTRHVQAAVTDAWHRELREQAWEDAGSLADPGEHMREVSFRRMELAALCDIRRMLDG